MATRIQFGATIATLEPDEATGSPWRLNPEGLSEHALLDAFVGRLDREGFLPESNPDPARTIVDEAVKQLGAEILEVDPPDEIEPGVKY